MDLFKILTLVFMIAIIYKIYLMDKTENFASTSAPLNPPTLIDDWNSINQLAQVSRQLMAGGVTVPGGLNIMGKVKESNNPLIPAGIILAWNGQTAPPGWSLCDGTNGTPDLRGRFIRMFNSTEATVALAVTTKPELKGTSRNVTSTLIMQHGFNDKGGSDSSMLTTDELPSHTHGVSDPGHKHNYTVRLWADDNNHNDGGMASGADNPNPSNNNSNPITNSSSTGISIQNTGSNLGHNNQPPYYVLSYIMKL